jgi:Flp pilus assembly protein TadD
MRRGLAVLWLAVALAAAAVAQHAVRLGTKDALKSFHRGWIRQCLGNTVAARADFDRALALALNSHFSILWASVARSALR